MPSRACATAGCSTLATWNRSVTLIANHVPERLCARHYEDLTKERPALARHYEPVVEEMKDHPSSV